MTLERRIGALEAKIDPNGDNMPANWGPSHAHLPAMTMGALRRLLVDIHRSGTGRLPICSNEAAKGLLAVDE